MDARDTPGLLSEALAGDQQALTRLLAALTPVVQARVARTLLASRASRPSGRGIREDVEDLTQEVLLALSASDCHVLRSWEAERGLSLEGFVRLVSKRHVVSFLRSHRRNPWKEELAGGEELEVRGDDPGPDRVVAGREQLRLLLDRLHDKLSPLGLHLFQLLYVQELSVPETMAATGLSADAVYAWRSRLRQLARELMSE